MNVGIVGKGFVGTAVFEGMKHAFNVMAFDKTKGWSGHGLLDDKSNNHPNDMYFTSWLEGLKDEWKEDHVEWNLVKHCDVIFVCVPTPMNPDGSCDTKIVETVCALLNIPAGMLNIKQVIAIKSTVPPGTTARINDACRNLHVCHNPEFLTERASIEDFKNQDRILIGGPREGTNVLKQLYETAYPHVPVTKTSSNITELVKYMTNCFLAVKVSFANEIAEICDGLGEDYDKVVEYATKDERLGTSHWAVPGPDGKKGFGGSCFPKDLNALISASKGIFRRMECNTMKGAWQTNLDVRPEKDWEELKGRAVTSEE